MKNNYNDQNSFCFYTFILFQAFSNNGKKVIIAKNPLGQYFIDNKYSTTSETDPMSYRDKLMANKMYGCLGEN